VSFKELSQDVASHYSFNKELVSAHAMPELSLILETEFVKLAAPTALHAFPLPFVLHAAQDLTSKTQFASLVKDVLVPESNTMESVLTHAQLVQLLRMDSVKEDVIHKAISLMENATLPVHPTLGSEQMWLVFPHVQVATLLMETYANWHLNLALQVNSTIFKLLNAHHVLFHVPNVNTLKQLAPYALPELP